MYAGHTSFDRYMSFAGYTHTGGKGKGKNIERITFLTVPFNEQMFLCLMKPNLVFFYDKCFLCSP